MSPTRPLSGTPKVCEPLWSAANAEGSPAVANGIVYAQSESGSLEAFNASVGDACPDRSGPRDIVSEGVVRPSDCHHRSDEPATLDLMGVAILRGPTTSDGTTNEAVPAKLDAGCAQELKHGLGGSDEVGRSCDRAEVPRRSRGWPV